MNKQDEDKRIKELEKGFIKRYNREVKVWREVVIEDKKIASVTIDINCNGISYILTEYLTPEQITDYVTLDINDKSHRYDRYVDAEIHVADLIGEQNGHSD